MDGAGDSPLSLAGGDLPRPQGETARSSWRGSMILVAVMFGWMLLLVVLAAVAAPNNPNEKLPTQVGLGVVVTPASGWYSAADVWDVGPNAVSFQKAGSFVAFAVEQPSAGNRALLDEQLSQIERDFETYRVLPSSETTVAGDVPGLVALFTGVANSSRFEGEIVVATSAGVGVVMVALAPPGQLSRLQADLEEMLSGLEVPR